MHLQDIGDTSIESLDHAIGLRSSDLGQSALNAQALAKFIELVRLIGSVISEDLAGKLFDKANCTC